MNRAPAPQSAAVRPRTLPLWPEDAVPARDDAVRALAAVIGGDARGLHEDLVQRITKELTPSEREALGAAAEPSPLLDAAALRWRLAAALVTAPQAAGPFDADAVAALLADTDDVLTRVAAVAKEQPTSAEACSAIRSALVRDAVALGNVVTRISEDSAAAGAKVAVAKAVQARVLSIVDGHAEPEDERRPQRVKLWVGLALAIVIAGGYHGYQFANRRPPTPRPEGVPASASVSAERKGRTLVFTRDGRPMPDAELSALRAAQAPRGRRVVELAPGAYAIEPEGRGGQTK